MADQRLAAKLVPGTRCLVDGFAIAPPLPAAAYTYFLTHAHSDHTIGLRRAFPFPIHCSPVTANLITRDSPRVAPALIVPLEVGVPVVVSDLPDAPPLTVTAHDANHCPGAVVLVFDIPARGDAPPKRIVHTGDCRWNEALTSVLTQRGAPRVDTLLLDTTYASPKHDHPPQPAAVAAAAAAIAQENAAAAAAGAPRPRCVVGSYRIGKERLYLGVAAALGATVWLPPAKRRVLALTGLGDAPCLTTDEASADIIVAPMGASLAGPALAARLPPDGFGRVIGVRPTGWAWRGGSGGAINLRPYSPAPGVVVYGVPYSEHSSFPELRACVGALRPRVLIPTVSGGRAGSVAAITARFADLLAPEGPVGRGRIDFFFARRAVAPDAEEEEERSSPPADRASPPAASPPPPAAADRKASSSSPGDDSWGPAVDDDWEIDETASDPPRPLALSTAQPFDLASVDVASQAAALAAVQAARPGAKRQATLAGLWQARKKAK